MDGLRIIGPIAYQGKEGCDDPRCTRMFFRDPETGEAHADMSRCIGYHCAYCDQPCSMMGHKCDASQTLLAAARAILDEET